MFNLALFHKYVLLDNVIVVSNSEKIIKACEYLNVENIFHKNFTHRDFIVNFRSVKRELIRVSDLICNDEFHFSHTQFAIFNFLLINTLIKSENKPIFHDFEYIYKKSKFFLPNQKYFLLNSKLFLLYIIYGIRYLELRKANSTNIMICQKISYIHKKCSLIHYEGTEYYDRTVNLFKNFRLDYPKIENLFIGQNVSKDDQMFDERSKSQIEQVYDILKIKNFHVKMHPKLGFINDLDGMSILPDYLPVELFFNRVSNSIVSFYSASLISACKSSNVNVVSLLGLIKSSDKYYSEIEEELKNKSNSKILFPKDINELLLLLI